MKKITIIGGANIDYTITSKHPLIKGDSLPSNMEESFGGVGRNIAETLSRLNIDTTFITALSFKDKGQHLVKHLNDTSCTTISIPCDKTSQYVMILDQHHDLYMGFNDMNSLENALNIDKIKPYHDKIKDSDYLVIEGNLNESLIEYIFNVYKNIPIIVDGISAQKVIKFKPYLHNIFMMKMNALEANALLDKDYQSFNELKHASMTLHDKGINHVLLTLGERGAFYGSTLGIIHDHYPTDEVVNTSGAGDSFLAGCIYALINHHPILKTALSMSKITLKSLNAVNQSLTETLLLAEMERLNE